ncbi:unnamed protein product [Paramecium primaurelia]|uniref:Transmembrane protein n=1 Tax=Paramecium primaurelia TaxID=5886 RepID=A0A8S1Q995_PARPR|nr:unnamed protein product [Paramecium primaurelia]
MYLTASVIQNGNTTIISKQMNNTFIPYMIEDKWQSENSIHSDEMDQDSNNTCCYQIAQLANANEQPLKQIHNKVWNFYFIKWIQIKKILHQKFSQIIKVYLCCKHFQFIRNLNSIQILSSVLIFLLLTLNQQICSTIIVFDFSNRDHYLIYYDQFSSFLWLLGSGTTQYTQQQIFLFLLLYIIQFSCMFDSFIY